MNNETFLNTIRLHLDSCEANGVRCDPTLAFNLIELVTCLENTEPLVDAAMTRVEMILEAL